MALNFSALTGKKQQAEKKIPPITKPISLTDDLFKTKTSTPIKIDALKRESFFAPSGEGMGPRDILREIPGASLKIAKDIAKDFLIQIPTKVLTSLSEIPDVVNQKEQDSLARQASDYLRNKLKIEPTSTFAQDVVKRQEEGMPQYIAILRTGSEGILDTVITGDLIRLGALAIEKSIKVPIKSHVVAWEALGRPKNIQEAKLSYRSLAQQFHPDKGGSAETFSKLNNAWKIIEKEGIPKNPISVLQSIRSGAVKLRSPIKDIFKKTPAYTEPFLGVRGQLPGYRERPGQAPAFGLSTRALEPVGGGGGGYRFYVNEFDAKGKLTFVPAEKAKSVDIFPFVETFISKGKISGWRISEAKTGSLIAEGKTQKEAIDKASQIIEKNKDNIEIAINKAIEKGGISPSFRIPQRVIADDISKAKASGQSFDEWVKGQGTPVFRGGDTAIDITRGSSRGISVSIDKGIAETFTPPKGGIVDEAFISPTAKILKESNIPKELQSTYLAEAKRLADPNNFSTALQKSVIEKQQAIIDYAKKNGFDGVEFPFENEIRIINNKALKTRSQLKAEWEGEAKPRQMKTSAEIPSLEKTAKEFVEERKVPIAPSKALEIQKVSYNKDITEEAKLVKQAQEEVAKKDFTKTIEKIEEIKKEPDTITTRKFKQTDEWKDFAKYAEENLQDRDIRPAVTFRHATMTAERVAEFLDGGLGGRTYKTIVKPVYDSAKNMTIEGNKIKNEVDSFNILEGSKADRNASLYAQKKITDAPEKSKEIAEYIRNKYDEFLERLNETRAKIGIEPIPKRQNYITHINELNTLSELFGGMERISVKKHIRQLKSELLDQHPDWTGARASDAAKRKVEGLTGVAQYVDARQPIFKFAKQRLSEYEADPSIIRSFNAYMPSALRYIHQAENVARNKAFKDVLPANAREFMRLWNTEQVAGRQAPSFLSPHTRRVLSAIRGTLGANTILGNMATTMMQLTSFPQVIAFAGVKNTFYGLGQRLRTYIPGQHSIFEHSRTKALRNLDIDIGLGDSLIDKALINIGKYEKTREVSARSRQAIDIGRTFLHSIMEIADQFTVGASYEAFYHKGVLDGLIPQEAMEYAEIMTGKTQANYFKEALPPFLNTIEGKTLGQFGTYGMNQWEMFKRDFGKDFKYDEKNLKSVKTFFKHFITFLTAAYIIDSISEKTFGRQPFDVKELVDDTIGFATGELTGRQLRDTTVETVANYIPFMGSVKFGSLPPVFDFGKDVIQVTLGSGKSQEKAIKNLEEKWIYNILLPYAGNQIRKSLQGIEAITDIDLPFVRNISKDIDIETNLDKVKAIIFSPYATQEALDYFENIKRRESIKEQYKINGTITSDENIEKLKKMSDEEFKIYTAQYAENTIKTINKKMEKEIKGKSLENIFRNGKSKKSLESIFK